ncbi:Lactate utilization protein A [Botrimarina colliarenosi]|uniref:Lactate utilization protein A n=1 Tax=Botrimarina colliarenosi TaxID=2528001 RepID=A0A5C6A2Q2_9BACT|nr:heterodisulfide reductase-related iron-sulfur binding cluster [Botrimarina colliarenosi]TWT93471.1 Lactate utilization protein A [Botrimarina colliarenosi]
MAFKPQDTANLLETMDYSVVQQCMHCGLCLPTCPTFVETGRERNSPRGRIALMRSIADGELELSRDFAEEMDYCVGCLACQTACPAGVEYASLLEKGRAASENAGLLDTPMRRVYRWLGLRVLMTRPWLLRLVAKWIALQQKPAVRRTLYKIGAMRLAPKTLRDLEPQAPPIDPPFSDARIKTVETPPAEWWSGKPRARVAVLTGCVQDISFARVNRATVDVLLAAGCEVVTPRNQSCCGSLHAHNGDLETAKEMARRTLDMFDWQGLRGGPLAFDSLDAVISNAGGCGSHLRHYGNLLADDPAYVDRARAWDAKLRDAQEFVWQLVGSAQGVVGGEEAPLSRLEKVLRHSANTSNEPSALAAGSAAKRLTYDASCHLCHGQKVVSQPVELLKRLPGHQFVPLAESDWCCGAAGVYSMTQPEQAGKLLARKLVHVKAATPDVIATANPGCMHQLNMACRNDATLSNVKVVHPMELLAEAVRSSIGT